MVEASRLADAREIRTRWGGFAWPPENADVTAILGALDIVFGEVDR